MEATPPITAHARLAGGARGATSTLRILGVPSSSPPRLWDPHPKLLTLEWFGVPHLQRWRDVGSPSASFPRLWSPHP